MKVRAKVGMAKLGLLLVGAAVAMFLLAAPAGADLSFCPQGEGAGQCGPPLFSNTARGLAVDSETDRLYVADDGNNRVDVFKDDGSFLFAFGWGVADGTTNAFQTCTTTCFKGIAGAGAGQFHRPDAVAVDNDPASPSFHDIYVVDRYTLDEDTDLRVQKFDPTGKFIWAIGGHVDKTTSGNLCTKESGDTCGAGARGSTEGSFSEDPHVAVGPGGVIYVLDSVRVGPEADLMVQQRLQRFQPSGTQIPSQVTLVETEGAFAEGIAVDSAGNAWVMGQTTSLREYSSAGALLAGPIDSDLSTDRNSLSIDAGGTLYAAQSEPRDKAPGGLQVISAYDSSGNPLRRFDYRDIKNGSANGGNTDALAVHASAHGDVFISEHEAGLSYLSLPAPGPIVPALTVEAKSIGNVRATLFAEVNPEGKPTEIHVDYVTQKGYEEQGNGFTGTATKSTEAVSLGAEGFRLKATEALVGCPEASKALIEAGQCLTPETKYRFRVVAKDSEGHETKAEGSPFTTQAPLAFGSTYATEVDTATARLNAEVNPLGVPATGFFEYVDDAHFQESGFAAATKAPNVDKGQAPLDFGSGEALATRSVSIGPLEPGTAYHYRLVATDPLTESVASEARVLRTFAAPETLLCENESSRIGFGALLPDCRAYEMVSPVDKGGGDIRPLTDETTKLQALEQSADSGEKLAYGSYRAFGDAASGAFTSQYIAQRIEGSEWQTHAINPPRGRGFVGAASQFHSEFKAFSADLCASWVSTFAEPPLAAGGLPGYRNLYRRGDRLCGEEGYEALAPIEAPTGLPIGAEFLPLLEGTSADGAEAIFSADAKLAAEGSEGQRQVYESAGGAPPHFVCVLPDGAAWRGVCEAGSLSPNGSSALLVGAISADGSRVFWSDSSTGDGHLYLRENPAAPESARLHGAAAGKGTLAGPATGTGNVLSGSELVKSAKAESGGFAAGQKISDAGGGIPAGATIVKVEETAPGVFTLTLSAKATKNKPGDGLTGLASETVSALIAESGAFAAGQEISAPAIPSGTTVVSCSPSCGPAATSLTLSAKATKTEIGAALGATSPCTEAATKACTVAVSKAAEGQAGTESSRFWGAAKDGSKAIFTTGDVGSAKAKLYSFEPDAETTELLAEGVEGVMGISEDANRVYFASREEIPGSGENSEHHKAKAGEANLYLHEAGGGGESTSFVATLAGADLNSATVADVYYAHTSRVSPDGLHAAFESVAALTGYDNTEAGKACGGTQTPGDPCREIYLYDAGTGQLRCASCNPSGERPLGDASLPSFETPLHGPRVLAEDGSRLYFQSDDAPALHDTNGRTDVYEWEAPGTGTCAEGNSDYSAQDEGCVDLVSTGQSHLDSRFVESDPSGENAFIATASGLLPQDPGGVDIYDARVGGGLPVPAGLAPSCEGEACQGPIEAPNDPTPASSTFEGAGNVHEEPTVTRTPCAKGKVKRHGKCVAKKHQAKKHKRAKRNRRAAR